MPTPCRARESSSRGDVFTAAAAVAMAAFAGGIVASAADALFISRVGFLHLGTVFALSSAVLVVVLAYLGSRADHGERGRLMVGVAVVATVVLALLGGLVGSAPKTVAIVTIVIAKQFSAALDLAFWVLVADRLDARQARKRIPMFVAAAGAGTAVGAFAVGPLVGALGSGLTLVCGAGGYAVTALLSWRFARRTAARRLLSRQRSAVQPRGRVFDRWRPVFRSRLAMCLAGIVGVAGVFAPVLYYLLGHAAAGHYQDEAGLATFFGRFRGGVQVVTLLAQAVIAPRLLARKGVGPALLLAPIGAVCAAVAVVVDSGLVVIAMAQASARILDTAIQTPAEKLAQNLLPRHVRGRVSAFLDGIAKRVGAIVGGVAATVLVHWWNLLAALVVAISISWLVLAWRLRRRFAEYAVAELALETRGPEDSGAWLVALVDDRSIARVREDLLRVDERQQVALEVMVQLTEKRRVIAAVEFADACAIAEAAACPALLEACVAELQATALSPDQAARAIRSLLTMNVRVALWFRCLGLLARYSDDTMRRQVIALLRASHAEDSIVILQCARARACEDDDQLWRVLESADVTSSEALVELSIEVRWRLRVREPQWSRVLRLVSAIAGRLRTATTGHVHALLALSDVVRDLSIGESAEVVLIRVQLHRVALELVEQHGASTEYRAAAVGLLAGLATPDDAPVLARALSDKSDDCRDRACLALRTMGADAVPALLVAANFGRRVARNAALHVLRDMRVTSEALDELAERELVELDTTVSRLLPLSRLEAGSLVVRRLEERIVEVANTLFLVLDARYRGSHIGAAARRFLRARDSRSRARALETLDTALPRPFAHRVLAPLDELTLPVAVRSVQAAHRLGADPPSVDEAVRAELALGDPLTRTLVIYALGSRGRAQYRNEIADAAATAAQDFDAIAMFRKLTAGVSPQTEAGLEEEMPRTVETMIVLSRIPMFVELSSRQLMELAEVVKWRTVASGETIVAQGEPGSSMYFVVSGRVRVEVHESDQPRDLGTLGPGEPFGEMALFEGEARSASVVAETRSRLGLIEHIDFEELLEEVPGIAIAVCRVLSRRVRALNRRG